MDYFETETMTLNKQKFVEAWLRSAHAVGIPPELSAPQLMKLEDLLEIDLRYEVRVVCERLHEEEQQNGI